VVAIKCIDMSKLCKKDKERAKSEKIHMETLKHVNLVHFIGHFEQVIYAIIHEQFINERCTCRINTV